LDRLSKRAYPAPRSRALLGGKGAQRTRHGEQAEETLMSHNILLPLLVFALFVASVVSALAAFKIYKDSRRQPSKRAVKAVICTAMAILFAFGAVWAMLMQPRL
jgi:hypothetical protein